MHGKRPFPDVGECIRRVSLLLCLYTAVYTGAVWADSFFEEDWNEQFGEMELQISQSRQGLSKKGSEAGKILNRHALIQPGDNDPLDVVIRRTGARLQYLKERYPQSGAAISAKRLEEIKQASGPGLLGKKTVTTQTENRLELYQTASLLRREAMFASPEITFDTLLFVAMVKPAGDYHMCDQYLGWNAKNGGGLFLLTGIRSGGTPKAINILENSRVESGDFKGEKLTGGAFLSPDLSFDGKTVVFAWTTQTDKCYHIFKVNIDGTGLVQLTGGQAPNNGLAEQSHNDFDPCWLPSGRIAFISERRGGYGRCHPRTVPTYTLYSMNSDGSDIICLSYHETNEWHPSVNNNGQIVYTRWDYLDRDDCIAHHLWLCDPDGCNPRSMHGNYPAPLTTLEGSSWRDGRAARPNGEWNIRAIPGTQKYIATASGHHTHSFGQLVMIDLNIKDDNAMSQLTGITTNQTSWPDRDGPYGTAWPLSESMYLCNYNNQLVLLDEFGNREVLYTASGSVRPIDPIPVCPRRKPPDLSVKTWQGKRAGTEGHKRATIGVVNVYTADMSLDKYKIKSMRIIQVFPQFTPKINETRIGYASESLARMVLGTVPVEEDGSVYCEAPVGKEIYFQLLDENGQAVHSMRAGTYVHPGEQLSCLGCHEDKWEAPVTSKMPRAFTRAPSPLEPDAGGVEPVNFYRLVKPVFDDNCASCHRERGRGPSMSYSSLSDYTFWRPGPGNPYVNGDIVTAQHGGSRTIPGKCGAQASKLFNHLNSSHNAVDLDPEELKKITLWLDCNSNELGAYTKVADQKSGKLVWPKIDCDPQNPTGVEHDRPQPGVSQVRNSLSPYIQSGFECGRISAFLNAGRRVLKITHGEAGPVTVTLYTPAGRQLWRRQLLLSVHGEVTIPDLPAMSRGMFIVTITTGSTEKTVYTVGSAR